MFVKLSKTEYPPVEKPILVWDGECPFCRYWVEVMKRHTADRLDYAPYQAVANRYRDLPVEAFQGAVQFIEPDGTVFSGPDTAYRSLQYLKKPVLIFHRLYHKSRFFAEISDYFYYIISENRPMMYRLTVLLFGKNPRKLKPYVLLWISAVVIGSMLIKRGRST